MRQKIDKKKGQDNFYASGMPFLDFSAPITLESHINTWGKKNFFSTPMGTPKPVLPKKGSRKFFQTFSMLFLDFSGVFRGIYAIFGENNLYPLDPNSFFIEN